MLSVRSLLGRTMEFWTRTSGYTLTPAPVQQQQGFTPTTERKTPTDAPHNEQSQGQLQPHTLTSALTHKNGNGNGITQIHNTHSTILNYTIKHTHTHSLSLMHIHEHTDTNALIHTNYTYM